jgi:hypothetical protein
MQPPILCVPEIKQPRREADPSRPSGAEVNECSHNSVPSRRHHEVHTDNMTSYLLLTLTTFTEADVTFTHK